MRRALLVIVAAFALTACRVDTTVDVVVQPDGSGTISVTAVADADLVTQAPGLAEDLRFDDVVAAGWQVQGPTATEDGGLQVVVSHPFATVQEANALLLSLNGPDGPLHDVALTRTVTDDEVTTALAGSIRVANGLDAFADPEVLASIGGSPYANDLAAANLRPSDVVTFTFTADLPGTASSTVTVDPSVDSGSVPSEGSALSWTVPLDGTTADLSSTFVLAQGSGGGVWGAVGTIALIVLVAWCILAIGFIVFVAKARRDRARRRTPAR